MRSRAVTEFQLVEIRKVAGRSSGPMTHEDLSGAEAPGERHQRGRVEVFEQIPDLVADLLACPHRVLLGAGEDCDGLGEFGVGGQSAVGGGVRAQDVGQHHRVEVGSDFLRETGVTVAVAGGGHRVDRVDGAAGRAQTGDQQAPGGVSMATGTGSSAVSPCSARSCNSSGEPFGGVIEGPGFGQ